MQSLFMTLVIGLISGTSVDGIDAALIEITGTELDLKVQLLAGETYPYPTQLREQILQICAGQALSMAELAQLDDAIAFQFATAAQTIQTDKPKATLIGSHGQTVYHQPPHGNSLGYSLQIGRGEVIAQLTKITTISNFRVADIAQGGQGAPLVSRVDAFLLSSPTHHRCVQNIGGIGNLTYLPARQGNWLESICGWDTGPGNALLDLAVEHFTQGSQTYDQDGNWARQGVVCETLLEQWLSLDFFHTPPPKSTGRELFGVDYLKTCLTESETYNLTPADILATLTELTASSIAHSYRSFLPQMPQQVLLCGGGSRNLYLKERLQALLKSVQVMTTEQAGVSADFKEAIAFGILAYWRTQNRPGNLPHVTGAKVAVPLGNIAQPLE
jgi:anhydro-N-acetylmuramic acid kinase